MTNKFLGIFNRTTQEDPLTNFRFHIEIENFARFGFLKAAGLEAKVEVIKYREGGQNTTERKSPGQASFGDVTLERGVILAAGQGDADILAWYKQVFDIASRIAQSTVIRRDVDIVEMSREGKEARRWKLHEAWPNSYKPSSDKDALGNDNLMESVTLCHEGFELVKLPPTSDVKAVARLGTLFRGRAFAVSGDTTNANHRHRPPQRIPGYYRGRPRRDHLRHAAQPDG